MRSLSQDMYMSHYINISTLYIVYGITYSGRVVHTTTVLCTETSVCQELLEQYERKCLRKVCFSIFPPPLSLSARSISFISVSSTTQSYLERQVLLPISQRNVGSIPDHGDHRARRGKCTSAIFGGKNKGGGERSAGREVVEKADKGGEKGGIVGIPISTK